MNKGIKRRVLIYPLIYITIGVILFFRQRSMIYFPTAAESHSYQEESVSNEEESIKVIVLNPGRSRAIIYFGGNAEAVIYNAEDFLKNFPDQTIYLFNYRGYGGSTGRPSERAIFSDALALYDQVKSRHSSISAMGRSLGSGVAVFLASQCNISRVVLITPYDSILNIAQRKFPIYPLSILLLDHYNSISRIRDVTAPTLVVMAENDKVIHKRHTLRLIDAFPEEAVTTITIRGAGHNTLSSYPEYHKQLKEFLLTNVSARAENYY